jgi:ribosomal protein S19
MNNLKKNFKNIKITPILLNKIVKIYNGKNYYKLLILQDMVGYKIGEFFLTRNKKK